MEELSMQPEDPDRPLMTESTVELYERARDERGKPASPESQEVGDLNQLIALLRAAATSWRNLANRARDPAMKRAVEDEAAEFDELVATACDRVRELGGAPPRVGDPDELPASPRDIAYAPDDGALMAWLAINRDKIGKLRERARDHGFDA
jgi:hypothetical protein